MATTKTHIAVYLEPAVEEALKAFCEQKGLKAKRGYMFSAGVNAALAQLFGLSQSDTSNVLYSDSNVPAERNIPEPISIILNKSNIPSNMMDNIPSDVKGNIPSNSPGNILAESIATGGIAGKTPSLSEDEVNSLRQELEESKRQYSELVNNQPSKIKDLEVELGKTEAERDRLQKELEEVRSQLQALQAENEKLNAALSKQKIPDLKTAYEGYKKEPRPGRLLIMKELKPFHTAILKGLTPDKGS